MKKVFDFIKKNWFYVLVATTVIVYFTNSFTKGPSISTATPSSTPISKVATFGTLTPGVSNSNNIEGALGRPINTTVNNGNATSQYKSTNQYRFHEVVFTNGVATLIKEIVNSNDNINSSFITGTYGQPPNMLYNNNSNNYFNLYVYPQNGIAYLGHTDGTVLEIWYFQPTTIGGFIQKWGSGFSPTPPSPESVGY